MMTKIEIEVDYQTLSHSLRIPLTEILGTVELLKREDLSSMQRNEVQTIQQAGNKLLVVINKILLSGKNAPQDVVKNSC